MKACALMTCVLVTSLGADGGLLKVPRVYNALITSHEPLLPSRAYSVSSPVVLLSSPYVALEPAFIAAEPPKNSSEPEVAPANTPEEPPEAPPEAGLTTVEPPTAKAQEGEAPPAGGSLPVPYGSGVPFPLTFYNPLSYSSFSYYPSFLAYSYPLVTPGVGLPIALPHAAEAARSPLLPSDSVKNNKPENTDVPDVSPPPPPGGAARSGDKKAAEAA